LHKLFGEVVWPYRDNQGTADGVLLPLVDAGKDTGHRMTTSAWRALKEHLQEKGYGDYSDVQIYRFFLAEVLEIAREATRAYKRGNVLKTNLDFRVVNAAGEDVLWYVPNECKGITVMTPDDHGVEQSGERTGG
jgi:hypothetical protein